MEVPELFLVWQQPRMLTLPAKAPWKGFHCCCGEYQDKDSNERNSPENQAR